MKDSAILLVVGFMCALVLLVCIATGYNYYRLDQLSERVILDHQKIEVLEGKPKPQGKTGSVGSMGALP